MRYTLLALILMYGATASAGDPGARFQITPQVILQDFRWEELGDKGETLLQETGPLFSFGVTPRLSFQDDGGFSLEANLQYSKGYVSYFGFLAKPNGQIVPYTTRSGYERFEIVFNGGYTIPLVTRFRLTPMAGIGLELWNRDLGAGSPVGYDESYSMTLVQGGLRGVYLPADAIRLYAELFVALPLVLSESVDIASRGQGGPEDLNLLPGINPRLRVETGISFSRVLVGFMFEAWTLSKSDFSQGYYQPESKRGHVGIKLGYTFGAE